MDLVQSSACLGRVRRKDPSLLASMNSKHCCSTCSAFNPPTLVNVESWSYAGMRPGGMGLPAVLCSEFHHCTALPLMLHQVDLASRWVWSQTFCDSPPALTTQPGWDACIHDACLMPHTSVMWAP